MKINVHHVLLGLLLAVLSPAGIHCVQAQDASYPLQESIDPDAEHERDKIIYSPGEADASLNVKAHVIVAKDTVAVRPIRKSSTEGVKHSSRPSSQEDDSILSFNFLYYIFEKYKLQDMVD
ncbi:MAG: hypothetical protein ABI477_08700 [Chryseolinea sp.]